MTSTWAVGEDSIWQTGVGKGRDIAFSLMSYALRFQTQSGTGRLLLKAATAGEWTATGGHSPAS